MGDVAAFPNLLDHGNKINLASGQRPFKEPWLNVDIRDQGYKVDVLADIRSLPMIKDNSCEVLVAHHCLEHIDMSEVGAVAKEWYRILSPGGKLAVFIPDRKALIEAWQQGRIDDYIFNVNMYGAFQGHIEDLHRWSYTYEYLEKQMRNNNEIPWSQVRRIEPWMMSDARYQGAECAFDWWILATEFTK